MKKIQGKFNNENVLIVFINWLVESKALLLFIWASLVINLIQHCIDLIKSFQDIRFMNSS